ncbi:MAG: bifunctional (p)ppGpp synthetase/guanosine-3',5'-bis(diphosphate) 3'-pyrophosphohydrolase [Bacteroidetes bacterium]|nr:bifunctional (p)ppGpp synthetase/guanosine-3',5'-bis(diphosphate) 3'-pyrophosphohydrolase [Bacteroidota bacterium]
MSEGEISILEREELERKEILKRYKSLLRSIRHELTHEQKKGIRAAFDLALDAHKDMRRKSGEPYIYHPIAVAKIAASEIGLGTTSIICALIHDVVEDSDYTVEDIRRKFGDKVARIVDGLTKIKEVFDHTDSMQAENFRKMLLTLSDDVRVILVKLCDRMHNMRTLDSMSRKNQLKIASETLFLYAPLAHRLGLYNVKSELEDLSIKYTQREAYKDISLKLNAKKAARDRFIRKFIEPIKKKLEESNLKFEIKGRPKSIYSILKKMSQQGIPFEQVYDLFAIRIILDSEPDKEKADCWTAYSIVTDIYKPNPARTRDWITTPKSNGYESLHTTVMSSDGKWVEVQVRTQRMDEIAEKGYAAHWKYKNSKDGIENDNKAGGVDGWLARIKDILENPSTNALEFLDDFKLQLIHEEIFVFTPNGDLKKMPKGASALDFAFEIHTQVGSKCIGAKVNNKLVPISHILSNGDQVEILTSEKQHPREEWLQIVITGKAIARIRNFLRESKREAAEKGKEMLKKRFGKEKVDFNEDNVQKLVKYFKVQSALDLYYSVAKELIASDKLEINNIINKKPGTLPPKPAAVSSKSESSAKKNEIVVGDEFDMPYSLAKCCSPIPGDDIFGFITIGEGVKIHRTNCPNAVSLMSNYGYRIIKAQWKDSMVKHEKRFLAGIKLIGIDDVGIVSSLTEIISKNMGVNMKAITIESHDGTFEGTISVYVEDTKHLDNLINKIKQKHPTMNVYRIEVGS